MSLIGRGWAYGSRGRMVGATAGHVASLYHSGPWIHKIHMGHMWNENLELLWFQETDPGAENLRSLS